MTRYIDAEKLRDEVINDNSFDNDIVNYYLEIVDEQPTEDVKKVVHGKWIRRYICGEDPLECSNCGNTVNVFGYKFCPNCGADMRGVKNDKWA